MGMSHEEAQATDLGYDHWYKFTVWSPDRDLNPQWKDTPDIDPAGCIVWHKNSKTGGECMSGIYFDVPGIENFAKDTHRWQVISLSPLDLEGSLLCRECGDHGFIREGRWIPA